MPRLAPWAATELAGRQIPLTITRDASATRASWHRAIVGRCHPGFVVSSNKANSRPVYISGIAVWISMASPSRKTLQVRRRAAVRRRGADPWSFHLTMDTNDTIETRARVSRCGDRAGTYRRMGAFPPERGDLRASFDTLDFGSRLKILEPGVATVIEPSSAA